MLSAVDRKDRPSAYTGSIVGCDHTSKIKPATDNEDSFLPILTTSTIMGCHDTSVSTPVSDSVAPITGISYVPVLLHSVLFFASQDLTSGVSTDNGSIKMTRLESDIVVN